MSVASLRYCASPLRTASPSAPITTGTLIFGTRLLRWLAQPSTTAQVSDSSAVEVARFVPRRTNRIRRFPCRASAGMLHNHLLSRTLYRAHGFTYCNMCVCWWYASRALPVVTDARSLAELSLPSLAWHPMHFHQLPILGAFSPPHTLPRSLQPRFRLRYVPKHDSKRKPAPRPNVDGHDIP